MLLTLNFVLRFVLAATEHLHRRISRLRDRVRQLEDALAALQAKQSSEPHPLLREDLLSTVGDDAEDSLGIPEDGGGPTISMSSDTLDAFGTLSISDHGISRFFGPTGGSEVRSFLPCWYFNINSRGCGCRVS